MAQSVTLLVTPGQAETLQLASMGSTPWLVLRNSKDAERFETDGTRIADLLGRGGRDWRLKLAVLKPAKPAVSSSATTKPAAGQSESSRMRTVTIIRATKEEKFDVAVPRLPPAAGAWLTNTDPGAATGND
jgi:hypothetical protein